MQEADLLPGAPAGQSEPPPSFDASKPPVPGARSAAIRGQPAWFVPNPAEAAST